MKISVITPTADRPVAFALCERWLSRQTLQPHEWIVVDGGSNPILSYTGRHSWIPGIPPGPKNFTANLRHGLANATGDIIVFMEDDDYYDYRHIARLVALLEANPRAWAAGDPMQRYYNLPNQCWRTFDNIGASLCQTAIRREAYEILLEQIEHCERRNSFGIDTNFWRSIGVDRWALKRMNTVVGIKGLPGQPGLGIGHRPKDGWTEDPDRRILEAWVGHDIDAYIPYTKLGAVAV